MTVLDRQLHFVGALRDAGLSVSVAESIDAARAVDAVGLGDRERLRAALAGTLLTRQVQRATFDALFDLYFPAVTDTRLPAAPARTPDPHEDDDRADVRAALAEYLRDGDEARLAGVVRDAVDRLGAIASSGAPRDESGALGSSPGGRGSRGGGSWSRLTTLRRVSAQTLLAPVLDAVLSATGDVRGGSAERRARATITSRIERFEQRVEAEVSRRAAQDGDRDAIARRDVAPSVERVPFLGANARDLDALRREVQPLARRLATRLALERRRANRGRLDVRATMRESLSTGGVPIAIRHRPRRPLRTDLVVLCDLSESVSTFARFTMLFVYALRQQFSRVRVFGFVDELDELTDHLTTADADGSVEDAVTRLVAGADVTWVTGRTDYGRALRLFAARFPDAIGSRTSLLVLGDARSNYGDVALPVLADLADRARHAYWLNPERRSAWDSGDSRAGDLGRVVPMIECRNLAQLAAFVGDLDG